LECGGHATALWDAKQERRHGRRNPEEEQSNMLKIRLRRGGASHAPFYRIVVSDSLRTPRASTVEQIGHYDPKKNPADVKIDRERVDYWVSKGAQLSPTVKSILKKNK
jgi:small subunit ribosomal protein S16